MGNNDIGPHLGHWLASVKAEPLFRPAGVAEEGCGRVVEPASLQKIWAELRGDDSPWTHLIETSSRTGRSPSFCTNNKQSKWVEEKHMSVTTRGGYPRTGDASEERMDGAAYLVAVV
ncbi:hypothetical protein Bbelb_429270 [Branchiostoma belcheri]|nr:hypothetical protein Bbelb_429270 [Branchiostoma belcheri]